MEDEEIDKDLTMLQDSEPTPKESAFDALLKNSTTIGSLSPEVNTQKQLDEAIRVNDVQAQFAESFKEGTVDPSLDQGRSMFEDTTDVRARNQSEFVKGIKAVGGGILQGGLIALEQVGYVADMDTYMNLFKETEDLSGNSWTRLMKDSQESLRESGALKIYEEAPDVNSISSQIFKWSSLEGAVSSAVGFGVTGLGAAKLVSYLGSMKKFQEMAKFTDAVMGNVSGKGAQAMTGWTGSKVGPLASSGISNYFMGQLMATDTYNQTMEELAPYIGTEDGQISVADAQKKAAGNAQDVVGLNMALTMTAYLRFGGIFKRDAKLKGLVENPTLLNQMKGLIAKGSPTAFTENVYQEMIQMEQIHDTKQEFGIESEYSKNYWDRMSNLALSNRALHAGALGIAGGPIQFAIIQRPMMGKQIAQQRKTYEAQTEARDWHQQVVANDFAKTIALQNMITEAAVEGNLEDAKFIDTVGVLDKVAHTVEWGTMAYLKNDVEKIRDFTQEQADEAGYTEGYSEKATKFLEVLDSAEQYSAKYTKMYNRGAVVFNRLVADQAFDGFLTATDKADQLVSQIVDKAVVTTGLNKEAIGADLKLTRDPDRFKNKSPEAITKLKKVEARENARLEKFLGNSYEYSVYQEVNADAKKYGKLYEDLYTDYKKITSPEYQAKGKAGENKSADEYKKDIDKAKQSTAETKSTSEASRYKSFAAVKQETRIESAEEKITRQEERGKSIKGRVMIKPESFSSIDSEFTDKVYTPKDIVASRDGRFFKVHTQLGAKNETGKVGANMPVLYEVEKNDKGKWVSITAEDGSKLPFIEQLFVLGTNSDFLYDEVLQPEIYGKQVIYKDVWAPYVTPDSLLRPNNALYQEGRRNMLDKNQAKSLNISARALKKNRYPWLSDYDSSEANFPFTGPYKIEYKKAVGEQGQNIIDIHKVVEGGDNIKIARLDEEYNHNYALIRDALAKGPVEGMVVENFSSRKNILRNVDDEGKRLDVNVLDFANMDKRYLPNGQVIIASKKAEWAGGQEAAATIEGVPIEGTSIVVDGESLEIPFDNMKAGDTYIIIRSPNGRLVNVATTSKSIEDVDIDGKSYTEAVVIPEIYNSINEIFKKELSTQTEDDKVLREQILADNKVNDSMMDDEGNLVFGPKASRQFRNKKYDLIADKKAAFTEHLKKTAYQHIRPNKNLYIRQGRDNNDNEYYERNSRGLKIVNPDWFAVSFAVSKKTGNIVPAVNIRNPKNFGEYHKNKNPYGGTKDFNIEDNPEQFFAALGSRRMRLSIDNLVNPIVDGVNKLKESANLGLITTNLNIETPFVGSSVTTEIIGDDIASQGSKLSNQLSKQFETRYGKILTETVKGIAFNQAKYTAEEFTANIEEFLNPDAETTNIKSLSVGENVDDITDSFNNFIMSLNIKYDKKALDYANDIINKDLTDEQQVAVDEITDRLENQGLIDNLKVMSRIVLAMQGIKDKVEAGDYKLRPKAGRGTSDLTTEKMTQPEGKDFRKHAHVYSELHGDATVFTRRQDGLYVIRKKDSKKSYTVYPSDLVSFLGDAKKLLDLKKSLSKTDKSEAKHVSLTRSIDRLEAKLEEARQFRDGTLVKVDPKGSTVSNTSLVDFYEKLQLIPGVNKKADFFKRISQSERSNQIAAAFSVLNKQLDEVGDIGEYLDEGTAKKVVLASRDAIFYSDQELKDLHEQASDTKNESFRIKIEALQEVKDTLSIINDFVTPKNIDIKRWDFKKKVIKDSIFPVLTTKVEVTGGKLESNINDDINDYIRTFSTLMYGVIRAEAAIRADLYKPVGEAPTEITPVKAEPEQTIVPATKKVKVEDPPMKDDTVDADTVKTMQDMEISEEHIALARQLESADLEAFVSEYTQYYVEGLDVNGVIKRHLPKFRLEEVIDVSISVEEAFNSIEGISDIGTKEEYANYLSTIFPDSVVGEVVYHGGYVSKQGDFNTKHQGSGKANKGFYFTPSIDSAEDYLATFGDAPNLLRVILDIKNPSIQLKNKKDIRGLSARKEETVKANKFNDGILFKDTLLKEALKDPLAPRGMSEKYNDEYIVFKKSQIHTLGSKKDIAQFKKYKSTIKKTGSLVNISPEQFEFEVKYAKKMLPQVPIEVVEDVVAMYNKFGAKAIGAYDKGVRFLVNNAATGTAYHETFHAVAGIYLRPFQKQQMAEEYGLTKWTDKFEEQMADEFAAYVDKARAKVRPLGKITSSVKKFFQKMLDWVKGVRSANVTTKIFEKIATGGFAQSENFSTLATTNERFNSPEEFGRSISQNNRVLLQELMAANQIKIIC